LQLRVRVKPLPAESSDGDGPARGEPGVATSQVRVLQLDESGRTLPEIFFELSGASWQPLERLDFALAAVLPHAMRSGLDVFVEGAVSAEFLTQVEELQDIWVGWKPDAYQRVKVSAAVELARPSHTADPKRAVVAFSGGVDGAYALIVHARAEMGRRTRVPALALLVHGFDVPLDKSEAFVEIESSARSMTTSMGVPLATLRTNLREICVEWSRDYAFALAAALQLFADSYSVGLAGADDGDAPPIFHLLSGAMTLTPVGRGVSRTARVARVAREREIAARLRVCWEGDPGARNCGRCEKCVRTKLNFAVNELDLVCFDSGLTVSEVLALRARTVMQLGFLVEIAREARRRGLKAPWVAALSLAIIRSRAEMIVRSNARAAFGAVGIPLPRAARPPRAYGRQT
jgi:hypothetical protein